MFNGNARLRGRDEKISYTREDLENYLKCQNDISYFAKKYFYIVTVDHGKIIIPLLETQKKILKVCVDPPDERNNIILMCSRQTYKTTTISIFMLHSIIFKKDHVAAILANREKTAKEILERVKMAYSLLPKFLQQGICEWNKNSIILANGSKLLASSTSSAAIRGYTISTLVLEEFAFVPINIQKEFTSSVIPSISSGKTSKIIFISTPNGMEMFYNIWMGAIRNENDYYPIKVLWSDIPGRDEKWKQRQIRSLPDGEIQFLQEYGCRFLGSSNTLINSDKLETLKPSPYQDVKWNGLMKIWENPIPGCRYVMGVDTGAGCKQNYSVVQILKINNVKSIEQVAIYRCNTIHPYDYASVIVAISDFYNACPVMIESNADVGGQLITRLFDIYEFDRIVNTDKRGLGVKATKHSKSSANLLLKRYIERDWIILRDRDTIHEISMYEEISLGCYAVKGKDFDDCVTSLNWGLYYILTQEFEGGENIQDTSMDQYRLTDNTMNQRAYTEFEPMAFFDN